MAKKKKYWNELHESAIETYIKSKNKKEKNELYKNIILPVFKELIQNIYYSFNFHTVIPDFYYIEHETITHLYEKLENINKEKFLSYDKNNKGFSYFGTIAKRYLIAHSNKQKQKVRLDELDHEFHIIDDSIVDFKDKEKIYHDKELISYLSNILTCHINDTEGVVINDSVKPMTEEDKEVAYVIEHLLKNYQKFDIYNKKQLYVYIREATDMSTRKITESLKKIKIIYSHVKDDLGHLQ